MNLSLGWARKNQWLGLILGLAACLLLPSRTIAFPNSNPQTVVPKWSRFEQEFTSWFFYDHPLENATLTVVFTSPFGDTFKVNGFWDGSRTWRARFSPDVIGQWKFHTICSDPSNPGLHNLSGQFLCTPPVGASMFERHGPVVVTRDRRHLAFADHTPFFWLADNAGNGALLAKPADWQFYAMARAQEKFTTVEWTAAPGGETEKRNLFTSAEHIQINLKACRQMDDRVELLGRIGLLNAIVPLMDIPHSGTNTIALLPEDQAILLLRYLVARWGADDVVWMLPCGDGSVERWQRIGRAVFGDISHAPVILQPGESYWVLDGFRAEPWVDVFGYATGQEVSEDSLQWLFVGPVSKDWKREPARPLINLAPPRENGTGLLPASRASTRAVRSLAWWSTLETPVAGVSYSARDVADWSTNVDATTVTRGYESWPNWKKALLLPAAKQMGVLAEFFNSIDFTRLVPAPELLAAQPGANAPVRYIAAARATAGDLAVIYVPDGNTVELNTKELPPTPTASWISAQTGARIHAALEPHGPTCQLSTPDSGDWLLLIQTAAK